jgi:hypothetical protein
MHVFVQVFTNRYEFVAREQEAAVLQELTLQVRQMAKIVEKKGGKASCRQGSGKVGEGLEPDVECGPSCPCMHTAAAHHP